jgi:hypothetical protein
MSLGPPPARAAAWQTLTVAAGRTARAGVEFRGRTDLLGSACDKFGGISGESRSCPEGSNARPMRQVAHICVTLAAQRRWNRRPGQADRSGLSLQRPSVTGSEPIIPQTWYQRGRNRKPPRLPRPKPHAGCPVRLPIPASLFPRPPPLRAADSRARIPMARRSGAALVAATGSQPRRSGSPRPSAAGPTKKFARISEPDQRSPRKVDRRRCDRVAHICVTLRHSRDRKDAEIAPFRALFGPKSVFESPKWRKSLPAQILTPSLQMLQKCSIVAHQCPIARRPKIRPGG